MLVDPDPGLVNEDIRPVLPEERHWSVLNMASLWIGMVICVPSYMMAASLIELGMSWKEALLTILLGNVIVLVPMVLNGHPGTKFGVPFPVLARASFGIMGAHVPSLLRGLVACGWFGIQTWVGGSAIYHLVNVLTDGALAGDPIQSLGINAGELASFLIFWVIQLVIIWYGVETIRIFETLAAPFLIIASLALLWWAWRRAGGFGEMLARPSAFAPGGAKEGQFWSVFFPSLTAMVGFWATLSLNIPDFTRYARSQRDQVLGQAIGLPATMTLFAFIGVAVTGASQVIYGEAIWEPTKLLGRVGGVGVVIGLFALSVATLTTNIAANVVSPANALINFAPQKISFRVGGVITAIVGILMMPWKLMADPTGYIFTWLIGYSALLGPIGGILIADYFLLRRTRLDLDGLYRRRGPYEYLGGVNPVAIVALILAVLPNLPGFLHQIKVLGAKFPGMETFVEIYKYAWFVGFAIAAILHLTLMSIFYPARESADESTP